MKFCRVGHGDADSYPGGVAYAAPTEALFFLPDVGRVENWEPLRMEIRDGEYVDYLANNLGVRLCSGPLRECISSAALPTDDLQWLMVNVCMSDENRQYYILHFPSRPAVLNLAASILDGDRVIKPVLSAELAMKHAVFTYAEAGDRIWFVKEAVARDIRRFGFTGIGFEIEATR